MTWPARMRGISGRTPDFVRRVTANVLPAFADDHAADRYPARDHLAAVKGYRGSQVGSPGNLQLPAR